MTDQPQRQLPANIRKRPTVRIILLSPHNRVLLIKYHNHGPTGAPNPCWTLAGGGREEGEAIEAAAIREIAEETGMTDVRLGPIVWYGEDGERSSAWDVIHQEHFILAFASHEALDASQWTQWEREQIIETRWWALEELRYLKDKVYPPGLADLLEPIFAGHYPNALITLPAI
jgi:8-oxo-dGTP pyrophosphatase MutT (NUDIX family)